MEIQGSQIRLPFLLGGDNINKREKEAQQVFLNNEKAVLKKLEENYEDALAEINDKIAILLGRQDSDLQHVVYQLEYQRALKAQISAILETLHTNEFETISEYLSKSYEDGFITTMYNLQGQGIPLVFPLDQAQIVDAIQTESKLSTRADTKTGKLYASLGDDIKDLQKKIAGEISRGIAGGQMYSEIARNISNWARIPKNNAMRITRTEMHRIQTKATMDACERAKSKGSDIVKQWDASLDKRTRKSHRHVDGEIKELNEKFSNGLLYPGDPNGEASEVINCRCALLQRARWALGNNYTKWSPDAPVLIDDDDGTTQFTIIEAKNFEDFKDKYKGLAAKVSGAGIPEHEEPKLLKTIKYSDKKAVSAEINRFEADAVKKSIETACVITKDGEVYYCFGVEDRVFPDFDLKEKLFGATISHNHPINETLFTFSGDDLELFQKYNLDLLRGCDEKYTYEFSRDASIIDKEPEDWMNFENFEHARIIEKAKKLGIGYRRWLNE